MEINMEQVFGILQSQMGQGGLPQVKITRVNTDEDLLKIRQCIEEKFKYRVSTQEAFMNMNGTVVREVLFIILPDQPLAIGGLVV